MKTDKDWHAEHVTPGWREAWRHEWDLICVELKRYDLSRVLLVSSELPPGRRLRDGKDKGV